MSWSRRLPTWRRHRRRAENKAKARTALKANLAIRMKASGMGVVLVKRPPSSTVSVVSKKPEAVGSGKDVMVDHPQEVAMNGEKTVVTVNDKFHRGLCWL